ncbi:MAG: hypothetical protein JOZ60_13035 [Verrucomicrobia bacterium]|nr:hypothetical protein [Verrucomicrobiota bacterium]
MQRRAKNRLLWGLGVGVLICLCAGGLLATVDLRSLTESYVSHTLRRSFSIGAIRIGWNDSLSLELRDVRLANATWGSGPDMVHIASISAKIDLAALLHGVLRYRELRLVNPYVLLEHKPAEGGNWRFGSAGSQSSGGLAIVPKNRTQFPTLVDFGVTNGEIVYRTAGFVLRLKFGDLTIHSRGDDQPISVSANGVYNKTPVKLETQTDSFSALRNALIPFGASIFLSTASGRADFSGTFAEPLDFEGADGKLKMDIHNLRDFAAIFGASAPSESPLVLAGGFKRHGDRWEASNTTGKIGNAGMDANLVLIEGRHGQPDQISAELNSPEVDLNQLLDSRSQAGTHELHPGESSLDLGQGRDIIIEVRVGAQRVELGKARLADLKMHARLAPGEATLSQLRFALAGGRIEGSARVNDVAGSSDLEARTMFSGLAADDIAQLIGTKPGQIAGQVYGGVDLQLTGKTITDALRSSQSHAVIAMTRGKVARTLVEQASSDLRALFRKGQGETQLICLLAVLDLHDGMGMVSPLRVTTGEATLFGGGKVDLLEKRVNLVFRSDPSSTSIFSMDVPLQISGWWNDLSVKPTTDLSPRPDARETNKALNDLPQGLREIAVRNPCLR